MEAIIKKDNDTIIEKDNTVIHRHSERPENRKRQLYLLKREEVKISPKKEKV